MPQAADGQPELGVQVGQVPTAPVAQLDVLEVLPAPHKGGGPTDDKPAVTLETPRDPDRVSSFLNIRVADIQAVCAEWSARGAQFVKPPKQHQYEIRWLFCAYAPWTYCVTSAVGSGWWQRHSICYTEWTFWEVKRRPAPVRRRGRAPGSAAYPRRFTSQKIGGTREVERPMSLVNRLLRQTLRATMVTNSFYVIERETPKTVVARAIGHTRVHGDVLIGEEVANPNVKRDEVVRFYKRTDEGTGELYFVSRSFHAVLYNGEPVEYRYDD